MSLIKKVFANSLAEEFRRISGQTLVAHNEKVDNRHKPNKSSNWQTFLMKYQREEYEKFNTRDLVFYFREVADRNGIKIFISNWGVSMSAFKKAKETFSPEELCLMIEFLFESEQDYLDKNSLSPNIFRSAWCQTIYADSLSWANDEYVPKKKRTNKTVAPREYDKSGDEITETKVTIGWGEEDE